MCVCKIHIRINLVLYDAYYKELLYLFIFIILIIAIQAILKETSMDLGNHVTINQSIFSLILVVPTYTIYYIQVKTFQVF